MTRIIGASMLTDLGQPAAAKTEFIELQFGAGTRRITTAPQNITWNGFTWQAVGGQLELEALPDSTDERGQGVGMTLSGVDLTLLGDILAEQYRGRPCSIWYAHINASGQVVTDPVLMFSGWMNDPWGVEEVRNPEGGSVTIRTRISSRFATWRQRRGFQMTVESHSAALAGLGFLTAGQRDTFFATVPTIVGRLIRWGSSEAIRTTPPGGGSTGGGRRQQLR